MGQQQTVVREFYERFGDGDLEAAMAVFSAEVRIIDPGMGAVEGLGALRTYLVGLKDAVPDARAFVERVFEAGDTVIVEGRFAGTSTEPDGDLPSEGRKIDLPFADFARVSDDRIVEYRTYYDQVGLLTQLGEME